MRYHVIGFLLQSPPICQYREKMKEAADAWPGRSLHVPCRWEEWWSSQGRWESLPRSPAYKEHEAFFGGRGGGAGWAPPTENIPGFKLSFPLGAFLALSCSYQGVAAGLPASGSWLCLQLCLASRLRGPLQVLEPHGLTP